MEETAKTKEHLEESKAFGRNFLKSNDLYWHVVDEFKCISNSLDQIGVNKCVQDLKICKASFKSKEVNADQIKDLIGMTLFQDVPTHPLKVIPISRKSTSSFFDFSIFKGLAKSVEFFPITMFKCSDLRELILPLNSHFAWIKSLNESFVLKKNEYIEDDESNTFAFSDAVCLDGNNVKRISPDSESRVIRSYTYVRPSMTHFSGDFITLVLVDDRTVHMASFIRFAHKLFFFLHLRCK